MEGSLDGWVERFADQQRVSRELQMTDVRGCLRVRYSPLRSISRRSSLPPLYEGYRLRESGYSDDAAQRIEFFGGKAE
eukprot:1536679-Pyramimonas_sp.AAC.4